MGRKFDFVLLIAVILLMMLGALMVFSATSAVSAQYMAGGKSFHISGNIFFKQVFFLFLAMVMMMIAMYADIDFVRGAGKMIFIISVFLLFMLPFFGRNINGATRWYVFGGVSFNPAEAARVALLVFLADMLVRKRERITDFKFGVMPPLIIIYSVVAGVLIQKDLSTAIVLIALGLSMLYLTGIRISHLLAIIGVNALLGLLMVVMFPYRVERIIAFFNPEAAPQGTLYQPTQSLIALGNGGLTGVGLGNSFQKYFFLPEAHTDYILSILGEEWGFIGIFFFIAVYFVLFWRGVKISRRADDLFRSLLAWGITLNFAYYAILHMMIVSHMVPSTGIGLPFVSYGGSALLANAVLAGLLLNLSAETSEKSERLVVPGEWQDLEMEV